MARHVEDRATLEVRSPDTLLAGFQTNTEHKFNGQCHSAALRRGLRCEALPLPPPRAGVGRGTTENENQIMGGVTLELGRDREKVCVTYTSLSLCLSLISLSASL